PLPISLLQVVLELSAPARMAQLAQCLGLDLPDALAGHVELTPHFLERPRATVLEPEPQLQHAPLAAGQALEHGLDLLLEELVRGRIGRRQRAGVRNEVAEVRVFLLTDRRLQRDRLLRDLDDLTHLVLGDGHALRDLFRCRLATELLKQGAGDADELVDRLHHMDRDADRPRLVCDGARDGLADPPRRVRGELVALLVVELLDRADQTNVPLLDQVQEIHAAADVLLRDRDDEPEVGLRQLVPRVVALLDELVRETTQATLLVDVGLDDLLQRLHQQRAKLLAEHDRLTETLGALRRTVDLHVRRQEPHHDPPGVALGAVDDRDDLVDQGLRLGRDLLGVAFGEQRLPELEDARRHPPQLLDVFAIRVDPPQRLVHEAPRLV